MLAAKVSIFAQKSLKNIFATIFAKSKQVISSVFT